MKRYMREMTQAEARAVTHSVTFWQFRLKSLAKQEQQEGVIEVLEFDVANAWSLITCTGEGCCANTWLIETTEGEFVYAEHWDYLQQENGCFPGTHVRLHRYPLSKRLIRAETHGNPVKISDLPVEFWKAETAMALPGYVECEILAESPLLAAKEH